MPTTDEELDKERKRLERLREQIAEANSTREEREAAASNDIAMAQLKAEGARLEAELAQAKQAAKVTSVKGGAEGVVEVNRDAQAEAEQRAKAATAAGKD